MIRAVVKNTIPYAGFCARKLLVLLLTMVFLFAGVASARAEALVVGAAGKRGGGAAGSGPPSAGERARPG